MNTNELILNYKYIKMIFLRICIVLFRFFKLRYLTFAGFLKQKFAGSINLMPDTSDPQKVYSRDFGQVSIFVCPWSLASVSYDFSEKKSATLCFRNGGIYGCFQCQVPSFASAAAKQRQSIAEASPRR